MTEEPGAAPRRAPRPGRRLALKLLLAGIVVTAVTGTAVATELVEIGNGVTDPLQSFAGPAPVLDKPKPGKAQTILLTGLDHRYSDGKGAKSRSDTMILVRLDPEAKATTILSLPRDLRTVIPGVGTAPTKLNSAWFYGGARLLTKTIRTSLLGSPQNPFPVNDVVSVQFDAFAQAVNHFNCLYSDIDRAYFVPPGSGYAQIDQPSGYQLLCGQAALAFVRFRHQDSDITREARQANYLTEARNQIDTSSLLTGGDGLLKAIGKYVQTNVNGSRQLLGIAKLAVNITDKPTKRVALGTTFATDGSGDVLTTPADLARARQQFLHPTVAKPQKPSTSGKAKRSTSHRKRRHRSPSALPSTMTTDVAGGAQVAAAVRPAAAGISVLYPSALLGRGRYVDEMSRGYRILDKQRHPKWPAYRIVVSTGMNGQYYGIEGTTWKDPPILGLTSDSIQLGGRTWKVQYDGDKIRRLVWSAPTGTYWISNTLTSDLSAGEMYALARTFGRGTGG